jgi:hypothetical protein
MNRMDQAEYWQYRAALIDWASLPEGQRGPEPRKPGASRPGLTRVGLVQPAIPAWLERFSLKSLALFALKMALFAGLAHLLAGCGGVASDTDPPIDATADVGAPAPDAGTRQARPEGEVVGALPRCLHSPDAGAGLCQQMRFGERLGSSTEGWCAFWVSCP